MHDTELYRQILGLLPPWTVTTVALDLTSQTVSVTVDPGPGPFACPECPRSVAGYDTKRRRWRHLDTCQLTTFIDAEVPRIQCPAHGIRQIVVPWAERHSRFTALFERWAIDLLRACSIRAAATLLRLKWAQMWGIKARAVRRGLKRRTHDLMAHLGVDEKAIAKGHRYLTVVADLDRKRVLYVDEGRSQESLDRFWWQLTPEQHDALQAVAMDMWEPYIQSTKAHVDEAEAKIVFDKFHIIQHLHTAVDQVRRAEHRGLRQAEDDRLTGTKYLWLRRPQDLTASQRRQLRTLLQSDLKVARAWMLKEQFQRFWTYAYHGAATKFFVRWFWRATHSRLRPIAQVAKMIQRHLPNVLTYLTHGITNAGLEAINATIQGIKKTARGFRNVDNFKTAIYFHCGGLDLYPHNSV
jgi:transposase